MELQNYTIYKIACKDDNIKDCYVGKTINLKVRISFHKSCCFNPICKQYNFKLYQFIRNNNGWENFEVIEIITYQNIDKKTSQQKESYWYKIFNASLNIQIPDTNHKTSCKNYRQNNKDIINENLMLYRQNNKVIINEKSIIYRQNNRDKINAPCLCQCGSNYNHSNKARHLKSLKHISFINQHED